MEQNIGCYIAATLNWNYRCYNIKPSWAKQFSFKILFSYFSSQRVIPEVISTLIWLQITKKNTKLVATSDSIFLTLQQFTPWRHYVLPQRLYITLYVAILPLVDMVATTAILIISPFRCLWNWDFAYKHIYVDSLLGAYCLLDQST